MPRPSAATEGRLMEADGGRYAHAEGQTQIRSDCEIPTSGRRDSRAPRVSNHHRPLPPAADASSASCNNPPLDRPRPPRLDVDDDDGRPPSGTLRRPPVRQAPTSPPSIPTALTSALSALHRARHIVSIGPLRAIPPAPGQTVPPPGEPAHCASAAPRKHPAPCGLSPRSWPPQHHVNDRCTS